MLLHPVPEGEEREIVLEIGLLSELGRKRETQNPHSERLKKKCKNSDIWYSWLENSQNIGFKQDVYFSKLPYEPFEPETPNNEKNKEENTPHSQRLFLMET